MTQPVRARTRRPWQLIVATVALVCSAGVGGLLVVRQIGPADWWWPFIVALTPWALIVAAVGLVLAVSSRSKATIVIALTTAVVLMVTQWPLLRSPVPEGAADLRIVSTNLRLGKAHPDAVMRAVAGADVVAVQEITPSLHRQLQNIGIDAVFPHSYVRAASGAAGTAIWSRYPLSDREHLDGFVFEQLRATVELPTGPVTAFSLHPVTPRNPQLWAAEHEQILAAVDAAVGPVIAAGDFNATRDNRQLWAYFAAGMADSSSEVGAARQRTFAVGQGPFPLVAIDHVLVRDLPLTPAWATVADVVGSDHRALTVGFHRLGG